MRRLHPSDPGSIPERFNVAIDAEWILDKARQEPRDPCVRRVLRLIQLMREAEEYRLQIYERRLRLQREHDLPDYDELLTWKSSDPDMRAFSGLYFNRLKAIEQLGKRYRWSPTLRGANFHGLTQRVTWREGAGNKSWENLAVWLLMGLATRGSSGLSGSYILRFRQCDHCSKWFYGMTNHQRYCGINCRQKSHASSTEFREKRARYMREKYRPQQKELDQRTLKGIKHGKAT
jgi:hypothetical protein